MLSPLSYRGKQEGRNTNDMISSFPISQISPRVGEKSGAHYDKLGSVVPP